MAFHIDTVNTAVESDDFNGGTNSNWTPFLSELGKAFTPANDVLEYTSGTGPDEDSTAWIYDTDALSYMQDWSVAVDISNFIDTSTLTNGQEAYCTLVAGSDDLQNLMLLENYIEQDFSEIFFGMDTNGVEDVLNVSIETTAQQMALKISFDAKRKLLTSAYSLGGAYIVVTNFSTADWGFANTDTFLTEISFGTETLAISLGEVHADNFRIYGETPISNDVSLIELEYLRSYEHPGSGTNDQANWYFVDITSSHRVDSISVLTAAGDYVVLPEGTRSLVTPSQLYTFFETGNPITMPWNPANDGN